MQSSLINDHIFQFQAAENFGFANAITNRFKKREYALVGKCIFIMLYFFCEDLKFYLKEVVTKKLIYIPVLVNVFRYLNQLLGFFI